MYDERDFREFFYFSILFLKKKFLFPFFLEKSLHLGLTFTGTLGIEKETGGVLTSCNRFVTFVMV